MQMTANSHLNIVNNRVTVWGCGFRGDESDKQSRFAVSDVRGLEFVARWGTFWSLAHKFFRIKQRWRTEALMCVCERSKTLSECSVNWCKSVCEWFSDSLSPRIKTWHVFCPFFCAWSVKSPSSSSGVQLSCLGLNFHILLWPVWRNMV